MLPIPITCADDESAELFAMNRLNPAAAVDFEEHLIMCRWCADRVEEAQDYILAFRGAVQIGFSAGYRA